MRQKVINSCALVVYRSGVAFRFVLLELDLQSLMRLTVGFHSAPTASPEIVASRSCILKEHTWLQSSTGSIIAGSGHGGFICEFLLTAGDEDNTST